MKVSNIIAINSHRVFVKESKIKSWCHCLSESPRLQSKAESENTRRDISTIFAQVVWTSFMTVPVMIKHEKYWAKLWSIKNKNSKFCKFCHKIWFWNWIIYNEKSNCRLLLDFLFSFYFPLSGFVVDRDTNWAAKLMLEKILSVKLAEHPEFSACLSESDCYREGRETPFGRGGGLTGDQGG